MNNHFPSGFDPTNPLPGDGESLLRSVFAWRQFCCGLDGMVATQGLTYRLVSKPLYELLSKCVPAVTHGGHEARYWMLIAHVNCDNEMGVRKHLNYWWNWGSQTVQNQWKNVSKFIPGDHYHCLGERFNTMQEAKSYIAEKGFVFGKLIHRHVYATDGD